jgi:hypothetical protein
MWHCSSHVSNTFTSSSSKITIIVLLLLSVVAVTVCCCCCLLDLCRSKDDVDFVVVVCSREVQLWSIGEHTELLKEIALTRHHHHRRHHRRRRPCLMGGLR